MKLCQHSNASLVSSYHAYRYHYYYYYCFMYLLNSSHFFMHTTKCVSLNAIKRKNERTNKGTAEIRRRRKNHLNVQFWYISLFFQLIINNKIQYFCCDCEFTYVSTYSIHASLLWLNVFLDCIIKLFFFFYLKHGAFVSACTDVQLSHNRTENSEHYTNWYVGVFISVRMPLFFFFTYFAICTPLF